MAKVFGNYLGFFFCCSYVHTYVFPFSSHTYVHTSYFLSHIVYGMNTSVYSSLRLFVYVLKCTYASVVGGWPTTQFLHSKSSIFIFALVHMDKTHVLHFLVITTTTTQLLANSCFCLHFSDVRSCQSWECTRR